MNDNERQRLHRLLQELCHAQDDVTRFRELGLEVVCVKAREAREAWKSRIIDFVEGLSSDAITVNQTAGTIRAGSVITGVKLDRIG